MYRVGYEYKELANLKYSKAIIDSDGVKLIIPNLVEEVPRITGEVCSGESVITAVGYGVFSGKGDIPYLTLEFFNVDFLKFIFFFDNRDEIRIPLLIPITAMHKCHIVFVTASGEVRNCRSGYLSRELMRELSSGLLSYYSNQDYKSICNGIEYIRNTQDPRAFFRQLHIGCRF